MGYRSFNGINNVILCGTAPAISSLTTWSVSVWINPAVSFGQGGTSSILHKGGDATNSAKRFSVRSTSTIGFRELDVAQMFSTTEAFWGTTSGVLTPSVWQHLGVTWDCSLATGTPTFYVNGSTISAFTSIIAGAGTFNGEPGAQLAIGGNIFGTRAFAGSIAFLQYFNAILTEGEMKQSMNYPGSVTRGLRGFWPLLGDLPFEPDYTGNVSVGSVNGTSIVQNGPPINGMFVVSKFKGEYSF